MARREELQVGTRIRLTPSYRKASYPNQEIVGTVEEVDAVSDSPCSRGERWIRVRWDEATRDGQHNGLYYPANLDVIAQPQLPKKPASFADFPIGTPVRRRDSDKDRIGTVYRHRYNNSHGCWYLDIDWEDTGRAVAGGGWEPGALVRVTEVPKVAETSYGNNAMTVETAREQRQRILDALGLDKKSDRVRVRTRSWSHDGRYAAVEVDGESLYTPTKVDAFLEKQAPIEDVVGHRANVYSSLYTFTAKDGTTIYCPDGARTWFATEVQKHTKNGIYTSNGKRYRLLKQAASTTTVKNNACTEEKLPEIIEAVGKKQAFCWATASTPAGEREGYRFIGSDGVTIRVPLSIDYARDDRTWAQWQIEKSKGYVVQDNRLYHLVIEETINKPEVLF